MVAQCIHSVMRVAIVSSEYVLIEEEDVFCQLKDACNVCDF